MKMRIMQLAVTACLLFAVSIIVFANSPLSREEFINTYPHLSRVEYVIPMEFIPLCERPFMKFYSHGFEYHVAGEILSASEMYYFLGIHSLQDAGISRIYEFIVPHQNITTFQVNQRFAAGVGRSWHSTSQR